MISPTINSPQRTAAKVAGVAGLLAFILVVFGNYVLLEPLVIMLAPYAPHIAEEMWEVLGHKESVFAARWPAYDEKLASAGDVEIAVQVNGKLRSRLTVARGMTQDEVMKIVLSDPAVQKFVDGQKVKKVIYVQDRLVNLVI